MQQPLSRRTEIVCKQSDAQHLGVQVWAGQGSQLKSAPAPACDSAFMLCRSLLARVCLARAAITDAAAQEQLEKHGRVEVQDMMAVTKVVPQSALIFVKELLGVSDPARR